MPSLAMPFSEAKDNMVQFKEKLTAIERQLVDIGATCEDVRPLRRQLRWFAERDSAPHRKLVKKSAQDALNHASTLIGYYDGYSARGVYQRRVATITQAQRVRSLPDLVDYVHWVMGEILTVIRDLLARESLALCKNGPTKPGPERTVEVCARHLGSLKRMLLTLIFNAAKSEPLRKKVETHLSSL
ncbi:MAG: hypothetical protein VX589_20810 [Myxococcota bacterium]|nr:hypothetical protein [Myxococcota bacterium]